MALCDFRNSFDRNPNAAVLQRSLGRVDPKEFRDVVLVFGIWSRLSVFAKRLSAVQQAA